MMYLGQKYAYVIDLPGDDFKFGLEILSWCKNTFAYNWYGLIQTRNEIHICVHRFMFEDEANYVQFKLTWL